MNFRLIHTLQATFSKINFVIITKCLNLHFESRSKTTRLLTKKSENGRISR